MTPGARVAAAISVLDQILDGVAAEKALSGWARQSRFAGSKDRAAVHDHVFDALRRKRSYAAFGGAMTGRGLMVGALVCVGKDPTTVFNGVGHAPDPLIEAELQASRGPQTEPEQLDLPDWLWPLFVDSLGDGAEAAARALQNRAPVFLRVNIRKTTRAQAQARLLEDGIETSSHPVAATALEVVNGARRIRQSDLYLSGAVELQDAASQAIVLSLPLFDGARVLDLCAGGGGKTLAMAARTHIEIFAHDAFPRRMADLPARAARAGTPVTVLPSRALADSAPFDLVLCDVPCSGSGSWRRDPEGKWRLTAERLAELVQTQQEILDRAADLVSPSGTLAYATCSILRAENDGTIDRFLSEHPDWRCTVRKVWPIESGADGFFSAHLTRV